MKVNYGAKQQFTAAPDATPLLNKDGKLFIQQTSGKLLYLGPAVDPTILTALSTIAAQQSKPAMDTMHKTKQLLDYVATQKEVIITYSASDMVLAVHSDASYFSKSNARSRAGGHFFMSSNTVHPPNNGAILNIAQIIKNVMSSAAEAELGALYIMAREAVYIRIILDKMGHTQPRTPIQTDNSTAEGIINNTVQPKQTKAMDMQFHWLRDRALQEQLRFYWRSGKLNFADYYTKYHSPTHHRNEQKELLTPEHVLENLAREKIIAAGKDIGTTHAAHFAMTVIHIRKKLLKANADAQAQGKVAHNYCTFTGNTVRVFVRVC